MEKKHVRSDTGGGVVVVDTAACVQLSRGSVPEVQVNVQSSAFASLPLHPPLCFSKGLPLLSL